MYAIKGVYRHGAIECLEKPAFPEPVEVLIVFPEQQKAVQKIRGRFTGAAIDYDALEAELRELSRQETAHLLREAAECP